MLKLEITLDAQNLNLEFHVKISVPVKIINKVKSSQIPVKNFTKFSSLKVN